MSDKEKASIGSSSRDKTCGASLPDRRGAGVSSMEHVAAATSNLSTRPPVSSRSPARHECFESILFRFRPAGELPWKTCAEALSQAGQWYFDQASGELTYLPLASDTPARNRRWLFRGSLNWLCWPETLPASIFGSST